MRLSFVQHLGEVDAREEDAWIPGHIQEDVPHWPKRGGRFINVMEHIRRLLEEYDARQD